MLPKEAIQDASATGKTAVRLFYAKSDLWRKWVEGASGLGHLDMLAAAPVLLDPLMQGCCNITEEKEKEKKEARATTRSRREGARGPEGPGCP